MHPRLRPEPFLIALLATLVPLEARAAVSPYFAVRPNTVSVSGGEALLTVRSLTTDTLTHGFQFAFTFDPGLAGVSVATGALTVRSATLVPTDFTVIGSGTNVVSVFFTALSDKVWAAGDTVSLRATFTVTPRVETSVGVTFNSSNGPAPPDGGDTLAFVTFPSFPAELVGFSIE